MGTCTSQKTRYVKKSQISSVKDNEPLGNLPTKVDCNELYCLRLIYDDLVSRTPERKLNAKVFEIFFHMNPIFGGSLFRKFSNSCDGEITEEMFIHGILKYFKESIEEKLKFLFSIYNVTQSQGVSFNQLIAVLLNSPQEELKEILRNDFFLETLSVQEMSYYLMPSNKFDCEKMEKQYISNMSLYHYLPKRRKNSSNEIDPYLATLLLSLELNKNEKVLKRKSSTQSSLHSQQSTTKQNDQKSQYSEEEHMNKNRLFIKEQFKEKINKSLHCTQILRRYAEYIFRKNNLNKEHDQITFEKFKELILQNPKLYRQCFEGFHQHLWLHQNGIAKYKTIRPTISGYCTEYYNERSRNVYMINIKNSLMIFDNENMSHLLSIKNLEGLNIEPKQNEFGYGFVLRYQYGYYPEKMYIFLSRQIQMQWLNTLIQFQEKDVFKKYSLEQKIGQGSFCDVYRCKNLQLSQERAIKIFDKTMSNQQEIISINFQSEMLATCVMPNIIRAYERFETKTNIYIIMELIEGGTLFQHVNKEGGKNFSEKSVRSIMKDLLIAVKDLHEIGIIHRDLKLENILMKNEDGKFIPKIIDFGLAIYKIDLANVEENRKFVGTPNFIAPEIFYHAEYDETIDIFSLGVILHFMLTGTLPFNALNFSQIRQLTIDCRINFESKKWRKVSQQAKDLVAQMICFRDYRINATQALNHQWFTQDL